MKRQIMKSKTCKLSSFNDDIPRNIILTEVEAFCDEGNIGEKDRLHLRLISEEIMDVLPKLLSFCDGELWLERTGDMVEVHAAIYADRPDKEYRERLQALTGHHEKEGAAGVLDKIRNEAAKGLEKILLREKDFRESEYWSLLGYKEEADDGDDLLPTGNEGKDSDRMTQIERSVIANIADDVIVKIRGHLVDIIAKKRVAAK